MSAVASPQDTTRPEPQLPLLQERSLNWVGRFVAWVRENEIRGVIYRVLTRCLVFFLSIALIFSVFGLPFFIVGFKEFIRQEEHDHKQIQFERWHRAAHETNNHAFQQGRFDPLKGIAIRLKPKTREEIRKDLNIKPDEHPSDSDLLRCAAMKFTDYLKRYRISLVSK